MKRLLFMLPLHAIPWLFGMGLVAAAAELWAAHTRAPTGMLPVAALAVAFGAAQLLLLFSILVAVSAFALGRAALHLVQRSDLLGAARAYMPRDFVAAALVILPLSVTATALCVLRVGEHLNNRELAAILLSTLLPGFALVALLAFALLVVVAKRSREFLATRSGPFIWLPQLPGAVLMGAGIILGVRADTGIGQLDARLLAAPLALGAAALGAVVLRRVLPTPGTAARPGLILGTLLLGSLALALVSALATPAPSAALARYGAWSKPAIRWLRAMTDWDRDGYSGWFGGGDCAPWDPNVHPGAEELPGNGIDDNCMGGDASRAPFLKAPRPSAPGALPALGRPNLIVVTVETLRADHVSFLGYDRPTTPQLSALATSSIVFERLYATTPTTRLSLATLLSGVLPSYVDWQRQDPLRQMRRIGEGTPWLPELLRQRGYFTLAVHTNFRAFTHVEGAGFERGFDHYDTSTHLRYSGGTMRGFPGARQVDRALELLDQFTRRPFFLWIHLVEPHYLYEQSPSVPEFGSTERDLYDAEIAEADRQIGRLLEGLSARSLFQDSVLLVCGDHGEEFGEHGKRWHGDNLYEPQVRTAGLLRVPGLGPRRLQTAVALTDLAPSLLDLLGIQAEFSRMHGRNLVPLLVSGDQPLPPFYLENFRVDDGTNAMTAVVDWPYKLIYRQEGPMIELYDLSQDPAERHNRYLPGHERGQALLTRVVRLHEAKTAARGSE